MKIVYHNLYQKMLTCGVSTKELAKIAGTSTFAIWLKLRGLIKWKLHEMLRVCVFFRIPDAGELFSN